MGREAGGPWGRLWRFSGDHQALVRSALEQTIRLSATGCVLFVAHEADEAVHAMVRLSPAKGLTVILHTGYPPTSEPAVSCR